MVYVKLACLVLIAFLCEASGGQRARAPRRARPGCPLTPLTPRPPPPPRAVPLPLVSQPPPPPCRPNLNAAYRYERNLEEIISKLVNALIYTTLLNSNGGGSIGGGAGAGSGSTAAGSGRTGGGGAGGSGSGGGGGLDKLLDSLISLDLDVGEADLVNVDVLGGGASSPSSSRSASSSGGGTRTLLDLNNQQLLSLILLGGNAGVSGSSVGSGDNLLNIGAKLGEENLANVNIL